MKKAHILAAVAAAVTMAGGSATALPSYSQQSSNSTTSGPDTGVTAPDQEAMRRSEEVICKRTGVTGSRLGGRQQRTCLTRGEWDQIEQDAQEIARSSSRNQSSGVYDGPRAQ